MGLRRKADILLTFVLQTDWPKLVRRWFLLAPSLLRAMLRRCDRTLSRLRVWRKMRHFRWRDVDIRKPVHAVAIGMILAAIIAPISAWMIDNERYRLDGPVAGVITKPAPHLKDKLVHEQSKQAAVFNVDGQQKVADEAKDVLTSRVGGAEKKTTQLYTATFPDQASKGVTVNDNVNKVNVSFTPQFGVMDGRDSNGHVIYPLKDVDGQIVYTPKANALKEDVVLNSYSGDALDLKYKLNIPDILEARLDADGSIGLYSGDATLFGNITFGSDKDRQDVENARIKAVKNTLMFRIPAPTILQSGHSKTEPQARYSLDGSTLTVHVTGLKAAVYPLSIDPTFYISSTADFLLGSSDDNVDLAVANQVGRATLTGGSLTSWSTATNALPVSNFGFGVAAYNGYLYDIGGGNTGTQNVYYTPISLTTGNTTAAWTLTSTLITARVGLVATGYNGYIYAIAGENGSSTSWFASVEYAKINADGSLGAFTTNATSLNTARAYFAGAIYQGVIYVGGGETAALNATLISSVEYARINGDGSVGTWTTTTSLPSNRDRFSMATYNGFLYETGGLTNSTTTTAEVGYAPINSDGTIGAWSTSTSFPTARRDHGMGMERGYLYVYGGCTTGIKCSSYNNDTEYAVVNADGTIGQWQQTNNMANARDQMATTFYNGYLYSLGGCSTESASSNNCTGRKTQVYYTTFDTPGRFDGLSAQANTPFNPTASSVARFGGQAVALNGYVYYISGCSSTTGATYTPNVDYAAIGTDGSLGAWSTTTALPAQAGDNAGRFGFTAVAYNNKIFVLGGLEIPTGGGNDTQLSSVISNTQNTNGTLSGSWSNETAMPAAQFFHSSVIWKNMIYVMGGRDTSTNVHSETYYATIGSGGTIGSWTTSSATGFTARWGHSSAIYGNYLYLLGGSTNTTGTLTTGTQRSLLSNAGVPGNWTSDTAMPAGVIYGLSMVHNNFIYVFGGSNSAGTVLSTIYWASITPGTGVIGTWSSTNIGANAYTGTNGLAFARGGAAGVAVDGYLYLIGGCHAGMTVSGLGYDSCTTIVTNTSTTETEAYLMNNGGTGQTGSWSSSLQALPTAKADAAAVAYNGYIYSIGGCTAYTAGVCSTWSSEVRSNPISSNGKLSATWATLTTLPTATALLQAVAYNGFLYALGGCTSAGCTTSTAAVDTVSYAAISSTGTIGAWSTATHMNVKRRSFGAVISNGYIYAVGGKKEDGSLLSSTESAPINSDGSLGSWTNQTSFTTARYGASVVTYNGYLYLVGGYDDTTIQSDIQYAQATTGTVGSWAYTAAVPRGMNARQAVAANGYMYFIGNEGTTTEVSYADISSNGTLGTLHDQPNALVGAHAHGSAVLFKGNLYELGGCTLSSGTCSSVSSTTEYAGQDAISRAAHYSKLWDTQGIDTAPSQISLNGTLSGPGSNVSVILRTSSSFDPVLGVAQVINPTVFNNSYLIYALNSSGVNMGVAKTYALVVIMDDTQSGTFPDVNQSGSQTAVSSITLYYHANPSRRLRHGASFSNVGCNITPANGCILDTAP